MFIASAEALEADYHCSSEYYTNFLTVSRCVLYLNLCSLCCKLLWSVSSGSYSQNWVLDRRWHDLGLSYYAFSCLVSNTLLRYT